MPGATFGGDTGAGTGTPGGEAPSSAAAGDDDEERYLSLMEQPNILGSTGLLRTSYAGSAVPGTFRVSFLTDWFTTGGFLCNQDRITLGDHMNFIAIHKHVFA